MCWDVKSSLDNIKLISNVLISELFRWIAVFAKKKKKIQTTQSHSQFYFQLFIWNEVSSRNLKKMLN